MQMAAAYGAPVAALALIGPEAVAAAALAGGFDYEGDAVSYAMGLSKDKPDFTKSYTTGVINGAPSSLPFQTCDCRHRNGRKGCGQRVQCRW